MLLLLFSLSIVIINVILTERKIHLKQTIVILLRHIWYPCCQILLYYLAFESFDIELAWWRLFHKLDICILVNIFNFYNIFRCSFLHCTWYEDNSQFILIQQERDWDTQLQFYCLVNKYSILLDKNRKIKFQIIECAN